MVLKINIRSDCQVEAKDLFAKLSTLREESYRQFSDIISCHQSNISDGIRGLTEEVNGLQSELSVVRKEKSVLLETVDSLNGEIRQLNAKLEFIKQSEKEPNLEIIKEEVPDGESFEATQIDQVITKTGIETIQNIGADYETSMEQGMKEEDQHPIEKYDSLTDSNFGESRVGDVDEVEDIHLNENAAGDISVCPECKFEFFTNANMKIHMKNVHSELESDCHKDKSVTNQSIDMRHKILMKPGEGRR